uniref:Protein RFT1 homolog n=1 Tax=Trypanosoma vivax (strain Y486) TaxID=1055687 RepID=G0UD75_TRYVY|nr:putative RFT-1 [Trypanosoma vivax Y486]
MALLELLPLCRVDVFPSLLALARPSSITAPTSSKEAALHVVGLPEFVEAVSIMTSLSIEPCVGLIQSLDSVRDVVASEFWALLARLIVTFVYLWIHGGLGGETWAARMCFSLANLAYAGATVAYFLWLWNRDSGTRTGNHEGSKGHHNDQNAEKGDLEDVGLSMLRLDAAQQLWGGSYRPIAGMSQLSIQARLPWCYLSLEVILETARREVLLLLQFFRESCLRLLLTEGEHFALASMNSATAVGQYNVVGNLGSLAARLVFRVWETACFAKWSRDAAAGREGEAVALLIVMLRVSSYFGATVLLLGPPMSEVVLLGLFSHRWATPEMVRALQLYCYQLPLMGWYGLLDAFVRATASPHTLVIVQKVLVAQTALYLIVCFVALRLHWAADAAVGLIVANGVSTGLRCLGALWLVMKGRGVLKSEEKKHTLLRPSDLLAVFDWRITLVWTCLFAFTRYATYTATTTTPGVVSAILAFPVLLAAVLRWDADIPTLKHLLLRG